MIFYQPFVAFFTGPAWPSLMTCMLDFFIQEKNVTPLFHTDSRVPLRLSPAAQTSRTGLGSPVIRSIITLVLVVISGLTVFCQTAQARNTRNVLILHSYHQGLMWTDNISAGIKHVLNAYDGEVEIHFKYLDTKRIPGEEYFKQLIKFEHYKRQLANIDFDVVITSDNNALRFVVDNGDRLYPDVPVVFCGVNNFHPGMLKGKKNITGVVERIDYKSTLELMKQLHPDRSKVMVILDRTPTGDAIKSEFDLVASRYKDYFDFEYYQDFTLAEVPDRIRQLGDNDIIYLLTFNRDKHGTFIAYVDGIKIIQAASCVPIYGSWDFYFEKGIVGGMITSGFAQGEQAAILATQILNGKAARDIPFVDRSPNRFMFDHTEMRRFDIKMDDLPPDSMVVQQPQGFLDRYKRFIFGALLFILVVTAILIWRIIVAQRAQEHLEQTNLELDRRVAEQTRILAHKNDELKQEIQERILIEKALVEKRDHLAAALSKVKTLSGLLPICSKCKKIRDDQGYWNQIECYIHQHSDVSFSHSLCPVCAKDLYPELFDEEEEEKATEF